MLAQATNNNKYAGSLSKQHEKTKMADSKVHFQRFEKCKLKKFSRGSMSPDAPRVFWHLWHKKDRSLTPLMQSPACKHLTLWKH